MLRDRLIDTAIKLGIDDQLRHVRNALSTKRQNHLVDQKLHLLLRFTLAKNANCIDIGAYRGTVLKEMLRVAPDGKHIAYEPQPDRYNDLVNRFPSVDIRQAAVSNEIGETSFTQVKNIPGYSGLREIAYPRPAQIEKLLVRTETLDNCLPERYAPDLIKIDVEGAERLIFEGGIKTISRHKPIIVFEYGKAGRNYYHTSARDIFDILCQAAGLRIFDMDGNGPYSLAQFEETSAKDKCWDYVAHR